MPQRPTLSDDRMADDTVQHAPVADETVRMRTDGPAPDGGPQLPVDAADDTRPVTRDWLLGAPDGSTAYVAIRNSQQAIRWPVVPPRLPQGPAPNRRVALAL